MQHNQYSKGRNLTWVTPFFSLYNQGSSTA